MWKLPSAPAGWQCWYSNGKASTHSPTLPPQAAMVGADHPSEATDDETANSLKSGSSPPAELGLVGFEPTTSGLEPLLVGPPPTFGNAFSHASCAAAGEPHRALDHRAGERPSRIDVERVSMPRGFVLDTANGRLVQSHNQSHNKTKLVW
jgi:hypothetical protein